MSKYIVEGTDMTSVANAIRTAGGTSSQLSFPSGFVTAIGNISGGGSSNVVTGEFTSASSDIGTAKNISVPYTGNGYPLMAIIYPKDGYVNNTDISGAAKYRGTVVWFMIKDMTDQAPDYTASADKNRATCGSIVKQSSSDPTSTGGVGYASQRIYYDTDAGASGSTCARFRSKNQMSVFIGDTSFGFIAEADYEYLIVYSE